MSTTTAAALDAARRDLDEAHRLVTTCKEALRAAEHAHTHALAEDWLERARTAHPAPEGAIEAVSRASRYDGGYVTARRVTVLSGRVGKGVVLAVTVQAIGAERDGWRDVPFAERVASVEPRTHTVTHRGGTRECAEWLRTFKAA